MTKGLSYAVVLIKPDAHKDVLAEVIIEEFREAGFAVVKRKDTPLTQEQAEQIYLLDGPNQNLQFAARSLLGEGRHRNSTLVVLRSGEDDEAGALNKAQELKGKSDSVGIRSKYRVTSLKGLEEQGLFGDRIKDEISKNRLHIADTDGASLSILNMLLDGAEREEIKEREPELYREMRAALVADELKKQVVAIPRRPH